MRRRMKVVAAILSAALVVAAVILLVTLRQLEPRLDAWVTSSLSQSLESEVTLGAVQVNWFPLRLTAHDLTVRHHGRTDIPPLLVVSSFAADLQLAHLWSSTISDVRVDGMEIHIPPKDDDTGKRPIPRPKRGSDGGGTGLHVRHLTATNTRLAVVPRDRRKNARIWDIFKLEMDNLGSGTPSPFRAALTNPIPYGQIAARGNFGPWNSTAPGASPLDGTYTFAADLGTIRGLQGQLDATGTMSGILEQIATRGETRTPDFKVTTLDGDTLPLNTTYEALVDGTKGDVELTRVDVMLGSSPLQARGVVSGTHGLKGKRVALNITSSSVNLAELLHLISRHDPPMARGNVTLDAAFDLPQGDADVLDRLMLEGSFRADRLRFADDGVQEKLDTLSRRGQGRPNDKSIDNVASKVASKFDLKNGVLRYRNLTFNIEGATVKLDGTHGLTSKALALEGEVLLQSSASNTLTGFKRWLVKPFDALLRNHGAGTRLVIRVEGTQDQPKVALEIGKTLRGQ